MACLGRPRVQFYVSLFSVILLIGLLLSVGRTSVTAAVWSVFATSAVAAVISVILMLRATDLPFSEFVDALMPGVALTTLCVALIVMLDPTRASLGVVEGLVLTVGALGAVWVVFVGVLLRRGVLVLPTP